MVNLAMMSGEKMHGLHVEHRETGEKSIVTELSGGTGGMKIIQSECLEAGDCGYNFVSFSYSNSCFLSPARSNSASGAIAMHCLCALVHGRFFCLSASDGIHFFFCWYFFFG